MDTILPIFSQSSTAMNRNPEHTTPKQRLRKKIGCHRYTDHPEKVTPMNFPSFAGLLPGILSDDLTEAELDQIFRDRKKTIEKKPLVFLFFGIVWTWWMPIFHANAWLVKWMLPFISCVCLMHHGVVEGICNHMHSNSLCERGPKR